MKGQSWRFQILYFTTFGKVFPVARRDSYRYWLTIEATISVSASPANKHHADAALRSLWSQSRLLLVMFA